jgi:diaminopimelate epimerase
MKTKPVLKISKMSGSGNDFILVDNRSKTVADDRMIPLTRALCRRMVSVGADGMIFIEPSEHFDFRWRFFNADGSSAEMCGNGGRCAARFAYLQGIIGPEMTLETLAGPIRAKVNGSRVKLQLTRPRDLALDQSLELDDKTQPFDFLNTGVPHALIWVEDIEKVNLQEIGPQIRYHDYFKPAGTNVNLIQIENSEKLLVRTYERGVEGETLACGTGSVAAAAVAFYKNKVRSPVQVSTRGGEILTVHVEGNPGQDIREVYLEGGVRLIFEGEVFEEALLE